MKQDTNYKQTDIGEIPENWKVSSLGTVATFQNGKSSPARNNDFPYPVYGSNGEIGFTNEMNSEPGTIVVGRVGSYCGSLYYTDKPSWITDNAIKSTAKKGNDSKYIFYLMQTLNLNSMSGGSGQPLLNQRILQSIPIALPQYNEQLQIASVLSSLDDKIELNRKTNQTLEEMGKALFKHWFVNFEFPNNEGRPYKSSGGEMVDSELGEMPKGWEIAQLKDFGEIICGKTPPKKKSEYFDGDVPFIKIPDMHGQMFVVRTEDSLTQEGMNFQKQKSLPENSICVSCIATVGLVCITSELSQTNQQINSMVPKDKFYREYLYYTLSSMNKKLRDYASGGSATLNLNTGSFSKIRILKPRKEALKLFSDIVSDFFEKVLMNEKENMSLAEVRDSLLPRLMSGRLRV